MIEVGNGLDAIERVLDAMTVRARVIAHNVANQNTPGFKRYAVSFEEQLRRAHAHGDDPAQVLPVVERDESGAPGENNVSVMDELAMLDKVRLLYDVFTRRAGSHFTTLNKAIYGR